MPAFRWRLLALSLLAAGCVAPLKTTSGKPEVEIRASRGAVRDRLVNEMVDLGYTVRDDSQYTIVFEQDGGFGASLLLGSRYDSRVVLRVRYTLVENGRSTRVVADLQAVSNPGSAFERITDFSKSSKDAHSYQALLERVRDSMAGGTAS